MWSNPQFPADLVTFTEKILNRKLFLCVVYVVGTLTLRSVIPNSILSMLLLKETLKHWNKSSWRLFLTQIISKLSVLHHLLARTCLSLSSVYGYTKYLWLHASRPSHTNKQVFRIVKDYLFKNPRKNSIFNNIVELCDEKVKYCVF